MSFTLFDAVFVVLTFFFWSGAILGIANYILQKIFRSQNYVLLLILGTFLGVVIPLIMDQLHLLQLKFAWIWWTWIIIGISLLFKFLSPAVAVKNKIKENLCSLSIVSKITLSLFCFYLLTRAITALFPQNHGDPLLYNLLGPREWLVQGNIGIVKNIPNALIANFWDYLYIWPQILFSPFGEMQSLIGAQVFSQWIHLFWGMCGSTVLLFAIFRLFSFSSEKLLLIVWASILAKSLQWTASIAKNDWGAIFWVLAGIYCLEYWKQKKEESYFWIASIAMGFALVTKFNSLLVIFPVFFIYSISTRFKKFILFPFVMLMAASPIFLRNWIATDNPFYPMFANSIPTRWLSETWKEFISQGQPSSSALSIAVLLQRLRELFSEGFAVSSFIVAGVFIPWIKKKEEYKNIKSLLLVVIFSIALFCTVVGSNQEIRYLGVSLLLMGVLGLYLIWTTLEPLLFASHKNIPAIIILIIILASSRLPLHIYWKFYKMPWGEAAVLEHSAGDSKKWLRDNAKRSDLIITMADNELYYLSGWNATIVTERPDLDSATRATKSIREFILAICSVAPEAKYILEGRIQYGLELRFPNDPDWQALQNAIIFHGKSSRVVSMAKISFKTNCE